VETSVARELRDREALGLAAFAGAVSLWIVGDWRLALMAVVGTLAVRVMAGVVLHGTHPPVLDQFPGLTTEDTRVAWYVYRGRGDPAIARRTGQSLTSVRQSVRRIMKTWQVTTREGIADHVAQIVGDVPPDRPDAKTSREWMTESAWAFGLIAVGIGTLALSPDTAVLGGVRTWLGLCLAATGVIFTVVSTTTYLWEKWLGGHDDGPRTTTPP